MSYEDLVQRLTPTLRRISYKVNNRISFIDEDDLFQEALEFLWEEFRSGNLNDKTDSYILQGCFFHLKNYLRKAKVRAAAVSLDRALGQDGLSFEETYLRDEHSDGFLESLSNKLLIEDIRNNGLNLKEKTILCLFEQGLTTRQIGRRFGVSHVSIVKIMARIREKCQRYLDNE